VAVLTSGCSTDEVLRFGWPVAVTPQADRMRDLWTWSTVAALAVGVIVWGLILWSSAFHRKKSDELPRQFQYNHTLEIVLFVIPFVIVAVLFYYSATAQNYVMAKKADPDVTIDVMAFQWNWEFDYPQHQVKGATGQPEPGPDGKPQIVRTVGSSAEIPLLVLPAGKTIQYNLHSNDVIHSFYVPQFHFKRDVFPNPEANNQDWSFQNVIDTPGSFVGRCAELCGAYHSGMNFEVRALSPELYDRYIALRTQLNPASTKPYTAAEALSTLGCGELCSPKATTTTPFDTNRSAQAATGK
jgi:cytochrome c oxidase subunit 2